jgi:hypothetical protein
MELVTATTSLLSFYLKNNHRVNVECPFGTVPFLVKPSQDGDEGGHE